MKFLWHHALWLLLSVPVLAGAYVARLRRRIVNGVRYPTFALLREATTPRDRWKPHVPPFVFLAGLAALLVATARPALLAPAPDGHPTIVLLMDVSLSMAASDVPPTRLDAAREAAKRFVRDSPDGVKIAVVAFGGHADLVQPPTSSRETALAALDRLELQRYTAIGNGLIGALLTIIPDAEVPQGYDIFGMGRAPEGATTEVRRRTRDPASVSGAIILVSDGRGTMGVPATQAARLIAAFGIRVYTVGVGTLYGGVANVEGWPAIHAEFEEDTLKEIADITGGDYFLARNAKRVEKIYEKLGRRAMDTGTHEFTAIFALAGALLTLVATALSMWWSGAAQWRLAR